MGVHRRSASSYAFDGVVIRSAAAVVGPKEGEGPLGSYFDRIWPSELNNHSSFEVAERALLVEAQNLTLQKGEQDWFNVDVVMGGDLLDQLISTNFAAREHQRPLLGLFSACAVFTEGLGLGALAIAGQGPKTVLVGASSHHMAAERQFRYPIELGYQRTPTAGWTATAAGSCLLSGSSSVDSGDIVIEAATFGRVVDWGSKNPNDMGTAMAPAAFDTIKRHLEDFNRDISDYDQIYTGDLGVLGVKLLDALASKEGFDWSHRLSDCGRSLYDIERQDVHNGGSGAGCSASVFSGFLYHQLQHGQFHRILLVSTGALFSPTSYQQGESIPSIAHAVAISRAD
ncbi:MAG: stage V sporulation protein AD [Sulfobacillus thermosulfidooxidans]|uniref:Stage V sporulation protein AD n=1 Tax=Sulfobacillus thermosulfidooxidans TaxID=28034 RepID=A0A2T2WZ15_SULTH|nr:MAG: stage V sporulation protein AD [Sulfobacillus thermosulfidooxidans]